MAYHGAGGSGISSNMAINIYNALAAA